MELRKFSRSFYFYFFLHLIDVARSQRNSVTIHLIGGIRRQREKVGLHLIGVVRR